MHSKEIALFVPCYNEEKRLQIQRFKSFIFLNKDLIDIYFIDDGSLDETSSVISTHLVNNVNSFLIRHQENLGKGNALRKGIVHIAPKTYAFFGFIDADLDLPLEQVIKLYSCLKENPNYFMAVSKRNLLKDINLIRLRSISSVAMILIANKLIGTRPRLKDTQCGCKLLRQDIVETSFNKKFVSEWLFDIEIILRLKKVYPNFRTKICEVPVLWQQNSQNSNFFFRKNLKILRQIYLINSMYK